MGGTDDASNIIEVSVEEHAELHLSLYLEYGKVEDWIAYRGLGGLMSEEDRVLHLVKIGGQKGASVVWSEENREDQARNIREGKRRKENRERSSKSMIQLYQDNLQREVRSKTLKEYYETPEGKENKRLAHIKRSETMRKNKKDKPKKLTRSEAQRARRERERNG